MRILYVGEIFLPTGKARFTESLCRELGKHADVAVFGIGYNGDPVDTDLVVYPASLADRMGYVLLKDVLADFKPDRVVLQHTPQTVAEYLAKFPELADISVSLVGISSGRLKLDTMLTLLSGGAIAPLTHYTAGALAQAAERLLSDVPADGDGDISFETPAGRLIKVPVGRFDPYVKREVPVVGGGVDTTIFRPYTNDERRAIRRAIGLPEDAFVIGAVGPNVSQARYDLLIQSFESFVARSVDKNALLLLHTPAVGAHDLPELADEYGVGDRVVLTYNPKVVLPDQDLAGVYNVLDVYAHVASADTYPLALLEAAACGVPIVANALPAVDEVMGQTVDNVFSAVVLHETVPSSGSRYIVHPVEVANALLSLRADPDMQHDYASMANEHVQQYTWDSAARRLLDVIEMGGEPRGEASVAASETRRESAATAGSSTCLSLTK
jgi:glycosyltransferase involved in cell wall biosynthesis